MYLFTSKYMIILHVVGGQKTIYISLSYYCEGKAHFSNKLFEQKAETHAFFLQLAIKALNVLHVVDSHN